jgi:molecular chaperone GrpE
MAQPNSTENINEREFQENENVTENLSENTESNTDNNSEQPMEAEILEVAEDTESQKKSEEMTEFKDKYLRLYAEFENFRRRTAKEKTDLIKTAGESLMLAILPILDDFERAQKSMEKPSENQSNEDFLKELNPIKEGVQLIYNKMFRLLEQKGLKPMESSIGKDFDINQHESIAQIPAPSEEMKGKVIDEIERGYYLHDKILRFAKVVIGS